MADDGFGSGYINPVTGDYMSPQQVQQQGSMQRAAGGAQQMLATPGAVMQQNPYPAGSEEASWYDQNRQGAMSNWAPGMALSMMGFGSAFAEPGAVGMAGGALRNQFTGQFRRAGETPLPGNPYRAVNTQAKPVAANSAAVVDRMQAPAAADPALVQQNLGRMDNPMMQQTAGQAAPSSAGGAVPNNSYQRWLDKMPMDLPGDEAGLASQFNVGKP